MEETREQHLLDVLEKIQQIATAAASDEDIDSLSRALYVVSMLAKTAIEKDA